jgi:Glycosyl hydrolases family 2, TIM barrel domain/Glycosyl hydrolases family 2, sugar binding domain
MTATAASIDSVRFDHTGVALLDGIWELFPGDGSIEDLERRTPEPIRVPALWEAEGHLDLDGYAWYRRRFALDDVPPYATLRFGAVMDVADVYLNGKQLGTHDAAFTPFAYDVGDALRRGQNEVVLRVFDPPVDDPEHIRLAHGKQGWANWVFPSRPSLYMTYGGIWQSVELRRHGPVTLAHVFVDGDPHDLGVEFEIRNVSTERHTARASVRTLGLIEERDVLLEPDASSRVRIRLGAVDAPRWSPEQPTLHHAFVDVLVDGEPSDAVDVRFGLRTIRVEGTRILLNGSPYRMKSVLVQGFRADGLYDEGDRDEITREVVAAREMGFNTLRLHIKAFHPRYLDVCDELGMLVHCDIPVAEPIAHAEMGQGGELDRRCVQATEEQVCRDRNHPSVILWSAMNELCYDRPEARAWNGYERFARLLATTITSLDPTRPVIENDWPEPDPDRVFVSPILTAHWYGRLHAEYLDKIEQACERWRDAGRPLYVTEFGDWGLPRMPRIVDPPFWDTREAYAAGLASTQWPGTIGRFVVETQRYQGVSDRLQIEVFRRHDHIGGYCLTELTDVPRELNGLLDLRREPKEIAVREVRRANQTVLPMLALETLVVEAGGEIVARVDIANDGDRLDDVTVEVWHSDTLGREEHDALLSADGADLPVETIVARFDRERWGAALDELPAHRPTRLGVARLRAPDVPGSHDLLIEVRSNGHPIAANRYPIHVVPTGTGIGPVRMLTDGTTTSALEAAGVIVGSDGPLIVSEDGLDDGGGAAAREALERGETVVVLAHRPEAFANAPLPLRAEAVETAWGSSVFHFTTDIGALPSLPRRQVLVAEDSTIQARSIVVRVGGDAWPDPPEAVAYKPAPNAVTGRIVGSYRVGPGRLVVCQYRLVAPALRGDAAALAVLSDLVRWAADPPPRFTRERVVKDDGRAVTFYGWEPVR